MPLGPLDYGMIYAYALASTIDIPTAGTYVQLTGFTGDGPEKGCVDADFANNKIRVTEAGLYLILWDVSHAFTAAKSYYWRLAFDGVTDANSEVWGTAVSTGALRMNARGVYLKSLSANVDITLMVTGTDNGDDLLPKDAHLVVVRVG